MKKMRYLSIVDKKSSDNINYMIFFFQFKILLIENAYLYVTNLTK